MQDAKTYTGGCHCGKVRYEVTTDLKQVIECNCSICSKKGYLLNFVEPEKFHLLSGNDDLTDYQFNKKHIHHLFCPGCGIQSFATGTLGGRQMYAINVRCLDDCDVSKLAITAYDGKSR